MRVLLVTMALLLGSGGCAQTPDAPDVSAATPTVSGLASLGEAPGPDGGGDADHAGGAGAPISIPDIIIRSGQDVDVLKKLIEESAFSQCGSPCVTVEVREAGVNRCMRTHEAHPPVVRRADQDGLSPAFIVERGTTIVLYGSQDFPECLYTEGPSSLPSEGSASSDGLAPSDDPAPPSEDPAPPEDPTPNTGGSGE